MDAGMTERYADGRGRRAALAGVVLVLAALACGGASDTAVAADVERALVLRPHGISDGLRQRSGRIRVRIVARHQPLLRALLSPRLRPLLRSAARPALPDRGAVAAVEKRAARRAERLYADAMTVAGGQAAASRRQLGRIAAAARRRGAAVHGYEVAPAAVIVRLTPGSLRFLAALPSVQAIEPAPRPRPLSGIGTTAVGAPSWWSAGFTGGSGASDTVPADAAVISEAADPTHPAFAGTTVDNDPTQAVTDHGTHTGGIIASGDATYPGVAPGIDRLIGSSNELYALGIATDLGPGATDPAETFNISFGGPAANEDEDKPDDILTQVFGVGQAFGAGNDNVDGTPTVGNIGRNVLTVAGFNDVGTVASTDDVVLGISSRGPTPGGRKKPDLTAPAGAVVAPSAAWASPPANPDFTAMTGTSMAAPHVAGAMTLLEGAGIPDPMAQRAILINSARPWDGAATGLAGWAPPQVGWRPEVGWGELDLTAALAARGNNMLGAVAAGEASYYAATVPAGARATLAYELRGYFVGFPDPGTQTFAYTQSNLDLHQYEADGTEVMPAPAPPHGGGPDAIDPNDTVEQVRAPAGAPHQVIYKVEAASTVEGAAAEPFAIAAAQPLTPLDPPVALPNGAAADPAGPVRCSKPVTITTSVRNDSADLAATDAAVGIELPSGIELVAGDAEQEVSDGELDPSETSAVHSWTVQATSDGPKQVRIVGTGSGFGTELRREAAVTVDADCSPPGTRIDAAPTDPTSDPVPRFRFSGSGGPSGFECALDGAAYAPCTSPLELPGLAEGTHDFAVRAVDAAGNRDPSPASAAFTVDRSVRGAGLRTASTRLRDRGRRAGSVRVRLGEQGTITITGRAAVGRQRLRLRDRALELAASGHARVQLVVSRPDRRLLRRPLRRGRTVEITAKARFADPLGNRVTRAVTFDLSR
jgi:hypothetical protein